MCPYTGTGWLRAPGPDGSAAGLETRTAGNRTCRTSCLRLLFLLQSAPSVGACAASTCPPNTHAHTSAHAPIDNSHWRVRVLGCPAELGHSPEVVLGPVRAHLAGEGADFESKRLRFPQTQVAFVRAIVELFHAHHHSGGVGGQHSGGHDKGSGARGCRTGRTHRLC